MSATKTIFFVRHGEAEGNVTKQFQSPETPLTDVGHQQAAIVAKRCKMLDAELLISSTYKRAHQTAEYIKAEVGLPQIDSEHFVEIKQASSVQGKSRIDDAAAEYMKKNRACYVATDSRNEDAENYTDVQKRMESGLQLLADRPETKIIVTTHGAFLKSLLIHVLHLGKATGEIDIAMKPMIQYSRNTGLNVFKYTDGVWSIEMWNDHSHFGEYIADQQH